MNKNINKNINKTRFFAAAFVACLALCFAMILSPLASIALAAADKETTDGASNAGNSKGSVKEFYQTARTKIEKGRYVAGIEDLKKAIAIDKNNADVWSLYGFAARKAGSLQLAEKSYDRALSIDPDHLGALEYSGELYIEQTRLDKAQERLQRIKALCPQGCKELSLLEQAMSVKSLGEDISHKIPKLQW